jgi:hypothetical protein
MKAAAQIPESAVAKGDVTASGVDAVLAALGSPEELASQYMTDDLQARAEVSRSPLTILRTLLRWASLSVVGFFVETAPAASYSRFDSGSGVRRQAARMCSVGGLCR